MSFDEVSTNEIPCGCPGNEFKNIPSPPSRDRVRDEMEASASFRKWIRKRLRDEFSESVRISLEGDRSVYSISDELAGSREFEDFVESVTRDRELEDYQEEFGSSPLFGTGKPSNPRQSVPLSFGSELEIDDWSSPSKSSPDDRAVSAVEKTSDEKPVHVRLAGYETLLDADSIDLTNEEFWASLIRNLEQGINDESRPVFEASLRVHAKLLETSRAPEVHENLVRSYEAQCRPRNRLTEALPPQHTNGINFKVFTHEKLCRLMRLMLRHQDDCLSETRTADKSLEDSIERFVVFLTPRKSPGSAAAGQNKSLEAASILAILEPQAGWSARWIHGLSTRKALVNALTKSPGFLQSVLSTVSRGFERALETMTSLTIRDEPPEVFISGETVEVIGYLHGLHFLARLTSYSAGRTLLAENQFESSTTFGDFSVALLSSLNALASSAVIVSNSGVYETARSALGYLLEHSSLPLDGKFYLLAVAPLGRTKSNETKIWPHTLDILGHMLIRKTGISFITDENERRPTRSAEQDDQEEELSQQSRHCPAVTAIQYAADLLGQPFAVMNIQHLADIFGFVGRAFSTREVRRVLETSMRKEFFPALAFLYAKMDKYAVGQESRTQFLDSAAKSMLLKIVASPVGLRILVAEPTVFEELIRASIAPLRAPWSSSEIVSFVSSAAYFDLGSRIINDLAPQSLSTALEEISTLLEDPHNFHDPWDSVNLEKFVHLLSSLSLSTRCFIAFMADSGYGDASDEYNYPRTLRDLIKHSAIMDSQYHYLGLLAIEAFVWNLDIYVYLLNFSDFQKKKMLKLQELSVHEFEEDGQTRIVHVTDSCSLLRHRIIMGCYYLRQKLDEPVPAETMIDNECVLFSELPPPVETRPLREPGMNPSSSELSDLLENIKPGLRDSGWILEVRKAFKNSPDPMKNSVLIDLLDQMEKAIPTAEWVDNFKWEIEADEAAKTVDWLDEENFCFELVLRYAEENSPLENSEKAGSEIKTFFHEAHKFINYTRPKNFGGFDWFLATIFIVCEGKVETCKKFVEKIVRFPTAMFMWPTFGLAIDCNNEEEMATQCLLGQHVEDVIDEELPTVNWALKRNSGVHWWMICNRLMSQCFWGLLPWPEIVNFISICILHSADYVVYYCVSLLHHCQKRLMEDIMNRRMWPDHMYFGDFRCHRHMSFIDRIGKRYRNRVLPTMAQRRPVSADQQ